MLCKPKWMWDKTSNFARQIPKEMNLQSFKSGCIGAATSCFPKTAKALSSSNQSLDDYSRAYMSQQATLEIATFFATMALAEATTANKAVASSEKLISAKAAQTSSGWVLPEAGGGATINGRWYTEHALERMAPNTPKVMAKLEARALERASAAGLEPATEEFGKWMSRNGPDPRGIPPAVVEAEIAHPGSTGMRVILNQEGEVVKVIPGRK